MRKEIKLYNMIFPAWALYMVPFLWVIILPANFIFDSVIILAVLTVMKIVNKRDTYKRIIFKVWGLGFAADIIGGICMMIMLGFTDDFTSGKYRDLHYHPSSYPVGFLIIIISVIISGILIYILNYYGHFKELDIEQGQKKTLALTLAITTAPYLMFLPTELFY